MTPQEKFAAYQLIKRNALLRHLYFHEFPGDDASLMLTKALNQKIIKVLDTDPSGRVPSSEEIRILPNLRTSPEEVIEALSIKAFLDIFLRMIIGCFYRNQNDSALCKALLKFGCEQLIAVLKVIYEYFAAQAPYNMWSDTVEQVLRQENVWEFFQELFYDGISILITDPYFKQKYKEYLTQLMVYHLSARGEQPHELVLKQAIPNSQSLVAVYNNRMYYSDRNFNCGPFINLINSLNTLKYEVEKEFLTYMESPLPFQQRAIAAATISGILTIGSWRCWWLIMLALAGFYYSYLQFRYSKLFKKQYFVSNQFVANSIAKYGESLKKQDPQNERRIADLNTRLFLRKYFGLSMIPNANEWLLRTHRMGSWVNDINNLLTLRLTTVQPPSSDPTTRVQPMQVLNLAGFDGQTAPPIWALEPLMLSSSSPKSLRRQLPPQPAAAAVRTSAAEPKWSNNDTTKLITQPNGSMLIVHLTQEQIDKSSIPKELKVLIWGRFKSNRYNKIVTAKGDFNGFKYFKNKQLELKPATTGWRLIFAENTNPTTIPFTDGTSKKVPVYEFSYITSH